MTDVADPPVVDESEADRRCHAAIARARAGELLGPADMMAVFRISAATYARKKASGAFDLFKTQRPIGGRLYSGVLVARYLAGEPVYEPSFLRNKLTRRR